MPTYRVAPPDRRRALLHMVRAELLFLDLLTERVRTSAGLLGEVLALKERESLRKELLQFVCVECPRAMLPPAFFIGNEDRSSVRRVVFFGYRVIKVFCPVVVRRLHTRETNVV